MKYIFLIFLIFLVSCSSTDLIGNSTNPNETEWLDGTIENKCVFNSEYDNETDTYSNFSLVCDDDTRRD